MGRTPKPLRILALPPTDKWDELEALAAQGHTVHTVIGGFEDIGNMSPEQYDLIIGERCHRMSDHERKWLPSAIKEARRRKYGPAPVEEDEEV